MITPIPIDPILPDHFWSTLNEKRSQAEIDAWWDQPFAHWRDDGKLHVSCLDGGAHDRPTFYGVASTVEEANALATRKLTEWRLTRSRPRIYLDGATVSVVRMPQVPHGEIEVLATFDHMDKAKEYLASLDR